MWTAILVVGSLASFGVNSYLKLDWLSNRLILETDGTCVLGLLNLQLLSCCLIFSFAFGVNSRASVVFQRGRSLSEKSSEEALPACLDGEYCSCRAGRLLAISLDSLLYFPTLAQWFVTDGRRKWQVWQSPSGLRWERPSSLNEKRYGLLEQDSRICWRCPSPL